MNQVTERQSKIIKELELKIQSNDYVRLEEEIEDLRSENRKIKEEKEEL